MSFCPLSIGPSRPGPKMRQEKSEMMSDDCLKTVDLMLSIYREGLLFSKETIIAYRILR